MPVSVVCESTANVNAALRESLGSSIGGCGADDSKMDSSGSHNDNGGDCLQSKLVASAKRVLLSKIEYEEVGNYSQSVLESLKSKYIVLKPNNVNGGHSNNNNENGGIRKDSSLSASSSSTCGNGGVGSGGHNNNNGGGNSGMNGFVADTNGNNGGTLKRANPSELPTPKRILYPRENVRIGWKNPARKWQVGVGMMNVGNTCYLNSTLQALFHVPSMANWLMSDSQHMERCDSADAGCIICAMAKTLQASQSNQSSIRPYFVYSKLKSICKHLVMGRQEDAHEFLRYLVEAMEKSYLSRFRNYKDLDQYSKETTPLNQILGGYLKSAVRCLACGHVSVTFQHFQDLLLDIRKADTVEEALDGYFSRERLEDMGYKCEACKKKVSATKQFSLERAPIALCIQLKRFSMLGTKINKQITIKPRLDLTKFASRKTSGEQLTYKLVAMVTHLGASQHCGHYTAIGLTESGTYYNYDDSYVRPISVQSVCNTNAYIIFYEMDTAPARHVSSTQVSGAEAKENCQKINGFAGINASPNGRPSPQRIIGPQLPAGGLTTFGSNNNTNNSNKPTTNSPLTMGNKLGINRQSSSPANSSKIMIHFKNNNASGVAIKTNATSSTTTATATSSSGTNSSNSQTQNGLLSGTSKFQESAHTKSALASSSNKGQSTAVSNGNESSSSSSSDDDDEVSSSTQNNRTSNECSSSSKSTLPSMPKIFDNSPIPSTQQSQHFTNGKKTGQQPATTAKSPLKSLVPYEPESDDDDDQPEDKRDKLSTSSTSGDNLKNPLKRTSSSSDGDSTDDDDAKPSNGVKVKRAATTTPHTTNGNASTQSKTKQKNEIDEIFNVNKRNGNSNNNNNSSSVNKSSSPTKKCKSSSTQRFVVSSTTSTAADASDNDDDDEESHEFRLHDERPPFKRSQSTPPSPPVIKTKTGLWQVTTLQPVTASVSPTEEKTHKNPKNPFAATKVESAPKRQKTNGSERRPSNGNGYQGDSVGDSVVNELLKQSYRGYGGSQVLTWEGTETEIEKEIKEEARQQRRRDWEEEDENEMDRGRQKKVKAHKELPLSTPGYNPFQEQDNQRRWKKGFYGGGGGGHFRRNNFQRNKGAFKRFNYKYQQRSGGNSNGDHHRRAS